MAEKKGDDWGFLEFVALAVVLDVIFKQFPFLASIQPILPIAVLAGILYGGLRGSAVGVISAFFSTLFIGSLNFSGNLFFLQAAAGIIAGSLGGLAGKSRNPSVSEFVSLCVVAAIAFEALNNFLNGTSFSRLSGYYYLEGTALASALHIIAAIVIALLLSKTLEKNEKI
ncbi:MAG: hypothetical protein Q7R70_03785 [Candidatus Diapherotrites archaeon]|nr:hypothetical protein [Candidatus Diapherotrites archaeon]